MSVIEDRGVRVVPDPPWDPEVDDGAWWPSPELAAEVRAIELAGGAVRRSAGELLVGDLGTARHIVDEVVETVEDLTEADHLTVLRVLEDLKATTAAAQARVTVSLDRARRAREEHAGVPASRRCRGLAGEIALARRLSPHQGSRQLGLARAMVADMPHTLAALRAGELSERRAALVAGETREMSPDQRAEVDRQVCADRERLASWGDQQLLAHARRTAYEHAPEAMARRVRAAATGRRVTLRPAPDGMAYLSALLPAAQAHACHQALSITADRARAAGDGRGRGQVMADSLVAALLGEDNGDTPAVEVQLLITDRALFGPDDTPAVLPGYGTLPAQWARDLVARALEAPGRGGVWLRRVFTHPATGELVALTSRSRVAPPGLARFIAVRDGARCRTPWCDAPARHVDHVVACTRGGPTSAENLQGLCERCNYTKSLPAWEAMLTPALDASRGTDPPRERWPTVTTTTPTGHTYPSRPPPLGR